MPMPPALPSAMTSTMSFTTPMQAITYKECRACGNPIPKSAKRCSICAAPQTWMRHFVISHVLLSLGTAFVSVCATGLPAIEHLMKGDNSDIHVSYQGAFENHIKIVSFNEGNRPATWNKLTLRVEAIDSPDQAFEAVLTPGSEKMTVEQLVFQPASSAVNTFYVRSNERKTELKSFIAAHKGRMSCSVSLVWVDFAATDARSKSVPFSCDDADALTY